MSLWSNIAGSNPDRRLVRDMILADKVFLGFSFLWILSRIPRQLELATRPGSLYEPLTWLGQLFGSAQPPTYVWLGVVFVAAAFCVTAFFHRSAMWPRLGLTLGVAALVALEMGYGKIFHSNHMFVLAHLFGIALPLRFPKASEDLPAAAKAFRWFQAGLLLPYSVAGIWKLFDLVVRPFFKDSMLWLNPDALVVTSITQLRGHDLELTIPKLLDSISLLPPLAHMGIMTVFLLAIAAPFKPVLLRVVVPTIVLFHIATFLVLKVAFWTAMITLVILFLPYGRLLNRASSIDQNDGSTGISGDGFSGDVAEAVDHVGIRL